MCACVSVQSGATGFMFSAVRSNCGCSLFVLLHVYSTYSKPQRLKGSDYLPPSEGQVRMKGLGELGMR